VEREHLIRVSLGDNKSQGGRPQNPGTEDKIQQAQEMHASGKRYKEIADALGVPKSTVGFWLGKSKRVQ
jgi:DNA invertase Pin-like site-specific DNA recombinase